MASFGEVETVWSARLTNLRNVVRQHLVEDQISSHLAGVRSALDVGCGQGTQALALAGRGVDVVGVDPSMTMLAHMVEAADCKNVSVSAVLGTVERLSEAVGHRAFDLVCSHGLLMYLDDAQAAVSALAAHVSPGGALSITFRNRDALAFRAGVRGKWDSALRAFDDPAYINELGAVATAHSLSQVANWCESAGLEVEAWYGVRVFTDGLPADCQPDSLDLTACLAAETAAGRRDPYRAIGSQLHVIARRPRRSPVDRC